MSQLEPQTPAAPAMARLPLLQLILVVACNTSC